jgi:hypothetical protein
LRRFCAGGATRGGGRPGSQTDASIAMPGTTRVFAISKLSGRVELKHIVANVEGDLAAHEIGQTFELPVRDGKGPNGSVA